MSRCSPVIRLDSTGEEVDHATFDTRELVTEIYVPLESLGTFRGKLIDIRPGSWKAVVLSSLFSDDAREEQEEQDCDRQVRRASEPVADT